MDIVYYLILLFTVFLGGLGFAFFPIKKPLLKLLLAFSGAYLLTVTVMHVLPELFSGAEEEVTKISLLVLVGFFLQILLDIFSKGIEHGHFHIHAVQNKRLFMAPIALSLYIHSFIEGVPLAEANENFQPLFWGIILHNIPITIAFSAMMREIKLERGFSIFLLFVFALMTPLGALFGTYATISEDSGTLFLAVAAGIFLHISTTIIFETSEDHKFNSRKLLAIVLGLLIALLPSFWH